MVRIHTAACVKREKFYSCKMCPQFLLVNRPVTAPPKPLHIPWHPEGLQFPEIDPGGGGGEYIWLQQEGGGKPHLLGVILTIGSKSRQKNKNKKTGTSHRLKT